MDEVPPILDGAPPPLIGPAPRAKWRSIAYLLSVGMYPILLGILSSYIHVSEPAGGVGAPALPATRIELLEVCAQNVGLFAGLFVFGWFLTRFKLSELEIRIPRWMDLLWGGVWSIGLRLGVMAVMLPVVGAAFAFQMAQHKTPDINDFRPKIESLIDFDALKDPIYMLLCVTAVSMVTAGLREELWRAGFLAAFKDLLPKSWRENAPPIQGASWWRSTWRKHRVPWISCALAAVIFGLGHLPQGPMGVVLTGVLGFGLGLVLTYHRSLWVAVLAHGFFDASTFVALWGILEFWPKVLHDFLGK